MSKLESFTRVIEENHASIRFFIRSLGVNPAWVDDVAQEAFLVAYKKWKAGIKVDHPGAWLRTIARNIVRNETAKRNRRQRLFDENLTTLLLQAEADQPGAEAIAETTDRHEELRSCIGGLSDRSRAVVESRYFKGRNSTEIGSEFALSPSAVRKILFHSRQALLDCLRQAPTGQQG